MIQYFLYLSVAALSAYGIVQLSAVLLLHDRSTVGRRMMRRMQRWSSGKTECWQMPITAWASKKLSQLVFLERSARETLRNRLVRAGIDVTPEQYAARSYLILALGIVGLIACAVMQFWLGTILCVLAAAWGVMRQRDLLTKRVKAHDEAIRHEMPRFVRTLCRSLRSNRDIELALATYRKVAGPALGAELDILLAHLSSGGVTMALQQFQQRLGTEDAFRLCAALREIDRGVDQSASLAYLAEDMARKSKLSLQKNISTRPQKMRMTYLPAVGVCVGIIFYVLIVFVANQLNNLF